MKRKKEFISSFLAYDLFEMQVKATSADQARLLLGLQHQWNQRTLCDVVLKSGDGVNFEAHRLVLGAASEALAALRTDAEWAFVVHLEVDASILALLRSEGFRR